MRVPAAIPVTGFRYSAALVPHFPARYHEIFAIYGFLMTLIFIFVVTGEIVAVIQSFGVILGLSAAIVGMTVLGVGNGVCDLISNWVVSGWFESLDPLHYFDKSIAVCCLSLSWCIISTFQVASSGSPNIAIAAVYGGPVLNAFIGIGVSMFAGLTAHDIDAYEVKSNPVINVGMIMLVIALVTAGMYVKKYKTLSRSLGIGLFSFYATFLVTSAILEVDMNRNTT